MSCQDLIPKIGLTLKDKSSRSKKVHFAKFKMAQIPQAEVFHISPLFGVFVAYFIVGEKKKLNLMDVKKLNVTE